MGDVGRGRGDWGVSRLCSRELRLKKADGVSDAQAANLSDVLAGDVERSVLRGGGVRPRQAAQVTWPRNDFQLFLPR